MGCVPAPRICSEMDVCTPCRDVDCNLCTTAGCEKNAAGVGVCLQTHRQKTDCTVDECNLGCVPATGLCTAKDDSTPCSDTSSEVRRAAGGEKNAAGLGVCLQTHKQKTDCTVNEWNLGCVPATGLCTAKDDSTPCSDTDGNLCTTAGCEKNAAEVGVCLQTHTQKTDCTVNECNLGCVPATGLCTAKDDSTPCSDTDGNLCTTAGCEKNAAGVGVCLQTHTQKTDCTVNECNLGCVPATGLCTAKDDSTPCSDTDGNLCTTAGCEKNAAGVGVCLQTHQGMTTCGGCFTRTPGFWGTHPVITQKVLGNGLPSCGLVVNTTAAATPVSSTEDICSVGTDSGANHTSPQPLQLIRHCISAALNLAATAHAPQPGDCNSVFPGITQMFNTCCTGPTRVCDSGASPGAIDASGCIGTLDRFNNLETTVDLGLRPAPARPAGG